MNLIKLHWWSIIIWALVDLPFLHILLKKLTSLCNLISKFLNWVISYNRFILPLPLSFRTVDSSSCFHYGRVSLIWLIHSDYSLFFMIILLTSIYVLVCIYHQTSTFAPNTLKKNVCACLACYNRNHSQLHCLSIFHTYGASW